MKYDAVKRALGTLHFADQDVLKKGGLQQLARAYSAYPFNADGKKLCMLVPREMRPADAGQLPEAQLAAKVIVLERTDKSWLRVWPTADTGKAAPSPAAAAPAAAPAEKKPAEKNKEEPAAQGSLEFVDD